MTRKSNSNQPNQVVIFYSPDYTVENGFDTIAKSGELFGLLVENPVRGTILVEPAPATRSDIVSIHEESYVDRVLNGSAGQFSNNDPFSGIDQAATSVLASTGGVLRAVETVRTHGGCACSLSSGLHHAKFDRGEGYCTFNGLVIGALRAIDLGAQRVVIIDFDAHCGGGTTQLIGLLRERGIAGIEHFDVSVSTYDQYNSTEYAQLKIVTATNYLDTIARTLAEIPHPRTVDLVIYNAGMDPHEKAGGPQGISTSVIRQRENKVFQWVKTNDLPIAWVLAGGYSRGSFTQRDVAALHRITIEEAARAYVD